MKRKLAFIDLSNFKDWPAGGMLQYELAILPKLVKEFDVDIWGVSVNGKKNPSIVIDGTTYPINTWGNVKTQLKIVPNYWRGLALLLKKRKFKDYDIVYSHTGSCTTALSKIIDRRETKLIHHQHGLSHLHDRALMSLIQRPFVNYAQYVSDVVFVVSDDESVNRYVKTISNKIRGKFISIGSPIDLSLFPAEIDKNYDNKIKIIYTGRIDSHKNVGTLIDMSKELNLIYQDFSLVIIGDGDKKSTVVSKIQEYGLENKVILKGFQPRNVVLNELQNADIYVTASIGEGSSISVLEAYASGLPVVCFDVPGLSKQIIDNQTGKVVQNGNVKEMAKAILDVYNYIERYSINALAEAKKYDVDEISKRIIENI